MINLITVLSKMNSTISYGNQPYRQTSYLEVEVEVEVGTVAYVLPTDGCEAEVDGVVSFLSRLSTGLYTASSSSLSSGITPKESLLKWELEVEVAPIPDPAVCPGVL